MLKVANWGEDYRALGRQSLTEIIEGRTAEAVDRHLEKMAEQEVADRRNGRYRRHLLTGLGDIELSMPRTRCSIPLAVVRAYARRADRIDRMILACLVLGLSTGEMAEALLPVLDRPVSTAITVTWP